MQELKVIEKNGGLYIDSREVADTVGKGHAKLIRDIKGYCVHLNQANFGLVEYFIESTYTDSKGETRPCFLCSKKGCDLIAHKMIGAKGIVFSAKYIDRFYSMEKLLLEKQTSLWLETRNQSKLTRKSETDVLKQLVDYAKNQGSKNADMMYVTYSKLANKMAGVTSRDSATALQLNSLTLIENIMLNCIRNGMSQEKGYKDIYQMCKARLIMFADLAYLEVH